MDPENSDSVLFRDIRGITVIPSTASQQPRENEGGERAFYQTFYISIFLSWFFFILLFFLCF